MGIRDDDIARVRAATDIVALIGEYVQLRQVGRRWRGLCPFHTEKSPSFYVNAVDGLYHCFGCQASGDAITFVREVEHADFPAAVERLAGRLGITLEYDQPGENRTRAERRRLNEVLAKAEDWYHERLLSSADAAPARRYLRDRGFDGDEVRDWKLGWAPDDWDQLASGLRLSRQDLSDTGLGFINKRNRAQDFFRGRVLFPIHDSDGHSVGFGGRILPSLEGSKYINTSQTKLYDKSRVLFALDRAKAGIVAADEVIVCEGYTDVTALFKVGMPRAVATCGTALTDDHVQLLRKFARRIVLAFDADSAGQAAADRFYQWESKFDLDVVVAALPVGVDPADLAQTDADALIAAIGEARPFLEFRLSRILDGSDLGSAEHRARAAEHALAVIAEHPNDLVRDQYLMQVADRCRVDVETLRSRLRKGDIKPLPVPAAPRRRDDGDPGPRDPGGRSSEATGRQPALSDDSELVSSAVEVLRLAVNRPADVADWLDEVLFVVPLHLGAYQALANADTIHAAIDSAPADVGAFLSRLAVEEPVDDPLDPIRLLVRALGVRELSIARSAPEPDLQRLSVLARLVGELSDSGSRGEAAARELLALVLRQGETS